jgi:4-hydroxybenzoate polyprenyltransferase
MASGTPVRRKAPWLRSAAEHPRPQRRVSAPEALLITVVAAVIVAVAAWFLFFASGGVGPGNA